MASKRSKPKSAKSSKKRRKGPAKRRPVNPELLQRVVDLHFVKGIRKYGELAEQLSVGPKQIAPLIEAAGKWLLEEKNRLSDKEVFQQGDAELELKVAQKYGLRVVSIATLPNAPKGDLIKLRFWPSAAAVMIDNVIEALTAEGITPHVAVSGGEIIFDLLSALPVRRRTAHFYPVALIGQGPLNDADVPSPEANATIGWAHSGRLSAHLHLVTVSPYEGLPAKNHAAAVREIRTQRKDMLAGLPAVRDGLKNITEKANIVLSSLGTSVFGDEPPSSTDLNALAMTPPFLQPYGIDLQLLDKDGAMGDIGHCFFDNIGQDKPEWRLLLTPGAGTDLDGIAYFRERATQQECSVIVVAVGRVMMPVLLCALYAKLFNVLVTDRETARALLAL